MGKTFKTLEDEYKAQSEELLQKHSAQRKAEATARLKAGQSTRAAASVGLQAQASQS